jgi:hypothetical protein
MTAYLCTYGYGVMSAVGIHCMNGWTHTHTQTHTGTGTDTQLHIWPEAFSRICLLIYRFAAPPPPQTINRISQKMRRECIAYIECDAPRQHGLACLHLYELMHGFGCSNTMLYINYLYTTHKYVIHRISHRMCFEMAS